MTEARQWSVVSTLDDDTVFRDRPDLDLHRWSEPKQALYTAAIELFYELRFEATGVQAVADRAELSKGTFYHYFGSKDGLLRVISERFLARLMPGMVAIRQAGLTPGESIRQVCLLMVRVLSQHREEVVIFYEQWRHMTKPFFKRTKQMRDDVADALTAIVEEGVRSGEFRDVGPAKLVGFTIFGMCSHAQYWYDPAGPLSEDAVASMYEELIVGGLGLRP